MLILILPLALAGCEGGRFSTPAASAPAAVKPAAPPDATYTGQRTALSRNISIGHEILDEATGSIRESATLTDAGGKVLGNYEATYTFRQRFTQVTEGLAVTFWFSNPVQSASGSIPIGYDPRQLLNFGEGAVVRFLLDRDKRILDAVVAAGPRGPNREPGTAEIEILKVWLHHAFARVPKGKLVGKGDTILDMSDWAKAYWGSDAALQYKATGWDLRDRRPVMIVDMKPWKGRGGSRTTGYALIDMRTGALVEHETVAQFPAPGGKGATAVLRVKVEIRIGKKK